MILKLGIETKNNFNAVSIFPVFLYALITDIYAPTNCLDNEGAISDFLLVQRLLLIEFFSAFTYYTIIWSFIFLSYSISYNALNAKLEQPQWPHTLISVE